MKKWNAENKAWRKAWREANKEKLKQQRISRDKKNPERKSAGFKKWRDAHLDADRARQRLWYKANKRSVAARIKANRNPVESAARSRAYYAKVKDDPIFKKKNLAKAAVGKMKRRAVEQSVPIGSQVLIAKYIWRMRRMTVVRCYYCGENIPKGKLHIDHIIPLSKGGAHDVSNLCCACASCNLSKSSKHPSDFAAVLGL